MAHSELFLLYNKKSKLDEDIRSGLIADTSIAFVKEDREECLRTQGKTYKFVPEGGVLGQVLIRDVNNSLSWSSTDSYCSIINDSSYTLEISNSGIAGDIEDTSIAPHSTYTILNPENVHISTPGIPNNSVLVQCSIGKVLLEDIDTYLPNTDKVIVVTDYKEETVYDTGILTIVNNTDVNLIATSAYTASSANKVPAFYPSRSIAKDSTVAIPVTINPDGTIDVLFECTEVNSGTYILTVALLGDAGYPVFTEESIEISSFSASIKPNEGEYIIINKVGYSILQCAKLDSMNTIIMVDGMSTADEPIGSLTIDTNNTAPTDSKIIFFGRYGMILAKSGNTYYTNFENSSKYGIYKPFPFLLGSGNLLDKMIINVYSTSLIFNKKLVTEIPNNSTDRFAYTLYNSDFPTWDIFS